jgi:hypothetical protein
MSDLLRQLTGRDRRSIGQSNCVVAQVLNDPALFPQIIEGLLGSNQLIRMRCTDVAEKVSARHPEWLRPHRQSLLDLAKHTTQQELPWHLAQMLPRLELTSTEYRAAVELVFGYLQDNSLIVRTCAAQALADFSERDVAWRRKVLPLLENLAGRGVQPCGPGPAS